MCLGNFFVGFRGGVGVKGFGVQGVWIQWFERVCDLITGLTVSGGFQVSESCGCRS